MKTSLFKAALAAWAILGAASLAFAEPWSFGVIADTQWPPNADDGKNPNSVAADIIRQVDAEFIARHVRLVVAVGDTIDQSNKTSLDTRALYAQDLYNAGIAFYPLRGNHDAAWGQSGVEFTRIFPQIGTGVNNHTPADVAAPALIPAADLAANPPAEKKGQPFTCGTHFSAPPTNAPSQGVSYSFDDQDARFILFDQFSNTGNTGNSILGAQLDWFDSRLADPRRPLQAFVFGHKGILGGAHKDNLFGTHPKGDPGDADPAIHPVMNRFIGSMAQNGVRYYISGHDHHFAESLVTSPDGAHSVHQIISASDSNKFYAPGPPFSPNDQPLALSLYHLGYSIYTVDGPRVTAEYYGVDVSGLKDRNDEIATTPKLTGNWRKLWTTGYSLNGKEMLVAQGASYASIADNTEKAVAMGEKGYLGTQMRLLGGTNASTLTHCGRPLAKAVNTGWSPAQGTHSDILTLWGMAELGAAETADTYPLSLSFHPARLPLQKGGVFLATRDSGGKWRPAAAKRFVFGPWKPGCELGDYGIDATVPGKPTAWAVVNHGGEFAVVSNPSK